MDSVELKATFYGKRIYVHDSNITCSEDDLRKYLSEFNLLESLKKIGEISALIFNKHESINLLSNVPVDDDLLLELAYRLVKYTDNTKIAIPSEKEIAEAVDMCRYLCEVEFAKTNSGPMEIMMNCAYRQFIHQEKAKQKLPRTYYIYNDIWMKKYPEYDILKDIKEITGFRIEVLFPLVFMYLSQKGGFFTLYSREFLANAPPYFVNEINDENYKRFTKWCSIELDELKTNSATKLDLIYRPVIQTRIKPKPDIPEVFMMPSYASLFDKITSGLYFSLADRYNAGGEKNRFKQTYGFVFQEYVGVLLKHHLQTWVIYDEIQYEKGKDTVDWLVQKNNNLLLIEVKQSSIYLKAKLTGNMNEIEKDTKKTISKAITQLINTETIIKSHRFESLKQFDNCTNFQRLIVLSDPLYNANTIIKDIYLKTIGNYQYHIINIGDLETLLALQYDKQSLFDLIESKSGNKDYYNMDFKEYLFAKYSNDICNYSFLKEITKKIFMPFKKTVDKNKSTDISNADTQE